MPIARRDMLALWNCQQLVRLSLNTKSCWKLGTALLRSPGGARRRRLPLLRTFGRSVVVDNYGIGLIYSREASGFQSTPQKGMPL